MLVESLACIYSGLAQAFTNPVHEDCPDWLAAPGTEWPIFPAVVELEASSPHPEWGFAVVELANLPSASVQDRRREYEAVFDVAVENPICLYESQYTAGRIFGPQAILLKTLYSSIGLEIAGKELADHASLELAFLSFLAASEADKDGQAAKWRAARRLFIRNHAGRWLPGVGRQLSRSQYSHWAIVGQLLIASLRNERPSCQYAGSVLPGIGDPANCTLCGFCVQVCPTEALRILEDNLSTSLWLTGKLCIRCEKCLRVCPQKTLSMEQTVQSSEQVLLRSSPLARCPACGVPVASEAEIEEVCKQLEGVAGWVRYCLDCRISVEVYL